jgi:peptide/nickel transport system ATP-binding protein
MSALLEVEDLRVDLAVNDGIIHAVRGVSFDIQRGETLAVVGESGCGKSLTALAIMNLLPSTARLSATRLMFGERSLTQMRAKELAKLRGDRIALILQDPMTALNPSYTVGNQLIETLRQHRRISSSSARARAIELLTKVGIPAPEARLGQYPHQLSGGIRQRVVIAMALMCEPDLLIADEPTTALDVTIQAQILRLLGDLQKEFGMGMMLITHDLGVVASIADRVVVMYGGQIVEQGRAAAIFEAPLHPYTEGLLRAIPVPGATKPGEMLGTIPGVVPRQIGDLTSCGFVERCPYAMERCRQAPVDLVSSPDGRAYRCVLPAHEVRDRSVWSRLPEAVV